MVLIKEGAKGEGTKMQFSWARKKKALTLHHQQYGDVQEGDPETDRRGRAP